MTVTSIPVWLRARRAPRLAGLALTFGIVSTLLVDARLPLPTAIAVNPPTVPFVVYAPVGAVLLMTWQLSLRYEPNERLSQRPVSTLRALVLLGATGLMVGPLLVGWWLADAPWALAGARNLALVFWGTTVAVSVIGLRLGSVTATLLVLFVPAFTRTDQVGATVRWGLTEAPSHDRFAIAVALLAVSAGVACVVTGLDRRRAD